MKDLHKAQWILFVDRAKELLNNYSVHSIDWTHSSDVNSYILTINRSEDIPLSKEFVPVTTFLEISLLTPKYTVYTIDKREKVFHSKFNKIGFELPIFNTSLQILSSAEKDELINILTNLFHGYNEVTAENAFDNIFNFSSTFLQFYKLNLNK